MHALVEVAARRARHAPAHAVRARTCTAAAGVPTPQRQQRRARGDPSGWFWRDAGAGGPARHQAVGSLYKETRARAQQTAPAQPAGYFWRQGADVDGGADVMQANTPQALEQRGDGKLANARRREHISKAQSVAEVLNIVEDPERWAVRTLVIAARRCYVLMKAQTAGQYDVRAMRLFLYAVEGRIKYTSEMVQDIDLLQLGQTVPLIVADIAKREMLGGGARRPAASSLLQRTDASVSPAGGGTGGGCGATSADGGSDDLFDAGELSAAVAEGRGGTGSPVHSTAGVHAESDVAAAAPAPPAGGAAFDGSLAVVGGDVLLGPRVLDALEDAIIRRNLHAMADPAGRYDTVVSYAVTCSYTGRPPVRLLEHLRTQMRVHINSHAAHWPGATPAGISGVGLGSLYKILQRCRLFELHDLVVLRRRLLERGAADLPMRDALQMMDMLAMLIVTAAKGAPDHPGAGWMPARSPAPVNRPPSLLAQLRGEFTAVVERGLPQGYVGEGPLSPGVRRYVDDTAQVLIEELAVRATTSQWRPQHVTELLSALSALRNDAPALMQLVAHHILASKWTAFSPRVCGRVVHQMSTMSVFLGPHSVLLRRLERDVPFMAFEKSRNALRDIERIASALAGYAQPDRSVYRILGDAFEERARIAPGIRETPVRTLTEMVRAYGAATCADMRVYLRCLGAAVERLLDPREDIPRLRTSVLGLIWGMHHAGTHSEALVEKIEEVLLVQPVFDALNGEDLAAILTRFAEWRAHCPRFVERFDEYLHDHGPTKVLKSRDYQAVSTAFQVLRVVEPRCFLNDTLAIEARTVERRGAASVRMTPNFTTGDISIPTLDSL